MSTFTTSKGLERVANGADSGTWDVPTNSNWSVVDAALGQLSTITCGGGNITLSSAQYQCNFLLLTGTLTANIVITFPTTFFGPYTVYNTCTNNITWQVQLSCGVGNVIAAPPGMVTDIFNTGTGMIYRNLEPIGSYIDYAGTAVPAWVGFCTVPPYLNCTGATFSAVTYPVLNAILGGTTLPDNRGRSRYALDAGTGRITGVMAGGNTLLAAGGDQFLQSHQHTGLTLTENQQHNHNYATTVIIGFQPGASGAGGVVGNSTGTTGVENQSHNHSFTTDLSGSGASQNLSPLLIGGITMIRAG